MVSHSPSEDSGDNRYNEEEVPHTVPGTKKAHSFKDQRGNFPSKTKWNWRIEMHAMRQENRSDSTMRRLQDTPRMWDIYRTMDLFNESLSK